MVDSAPLYCGILATISLATLTFIFYGPNLSLKTAKRKQKKAKVHGLINYGNQCFMNALLQSLAACDPFAKWLRRSLNETATIGKLMQAMALKSKQMDQSAGLSLLKHDSPLQLKPTRKYSLLFGRRTTRPRKSQTETKTSKPKLGWPSLQVIMGNSATQLNQKAFDKNLTKNLLKVLNTLNNRSNGGQMEEMGQLLSAVSVLGALKQHDYHINNEEQDSHELFNLITSCLESEVFKCFPLFSFKDVLLLEGKANTLASYDPFADSSSVVTRMMSILNSEQLDSGVVSNSTSPSMSSTEAGEDSLDGNQADCCTQSVYDEQNMDTLVKGTGHQMFNLRAKCLPTKGLLASQLSCATCNHRFAVSFDEFHSVSLSIPSYKFGQPVFLQDCLNSFVSNEIIQNVTCEWCKRKEEPAKEKSRLNKSVETEPKSDLNDQNENKSKVDPSKLLNLPGNSVDKQSNQLQTSTFLKRLTFAKLPQLFIIHIQRLACYSDGTLLKKNDYIMFPELLIMDQYVYGANMSGKLMTNGLDKEEQSLSNNSFDLLGGNSLSQNRQQLVNYGQREQTSSLQNMRTNEEVSKNKPAKYRYKLNAVIVHLGSALTGHYVAYRKLPQTPDQTNLFANTVDPTCHQESDSVSDQLSDKVSDTVNDPAEQWYFTSDERVRKANVHEVLKASAYMLFYQRCK